MTRLKLLLFSVISLFSIVIFAHASAQATEHIDSFHSDITIQSNGEVAVKETVRYFFDNPKHGIIRHIPVKYSVEKIGSLTGNYNIYLTVEAVAIEKENGQTEAVSHKEEEKAGSVDIKIGDPQKEVNGNITYLITYKAKRAVNFSPKDNESQDEFYWNVTGTGWEVPIASSSAEIHFPVGIDPDSWKFACYTGALGSQQKECLEEASSEKSVEFKSKWELPPKEGLTIVAGFPKGILTPPTASEDLKLALQNNIWIYLFLLIPFVVFTALFIVWFLKGRDPKGKGTIIPQYTPPDNLTPAELGVLYDEKADLRDISSSIIDLAVRGYLRIREIEKKPVFGVFNKHPDYEIQLLKRDNFIPAAEIKIFEAIFPQLENQRVSAGSPYRTTKIKLTDLQASFPLKLGEIKEKLYGDLVLQGYFPKNPERVRNTYLFLGAVTAFLGIIVFANKIGILAAGSMFISGAIIGIFGLFMPKKTVKGVDAYEKILGLREYLTVAEEDRIKFHNAPAKNPTVFERLLPYAMVLGVEKEWAKQFEGIYSTPPSWYEGSSLNNFNALYFVNSLSNFQYRTNSAIGMKVEGGGAASGFSGFSSGGGFSGGGFGGGGGSSW